MLFCAFFLVGTVSLHAQSGPTSEQELKTMAEKLFEEKSYTEAMQRFSQLLSLHPASAEYNYYYGASLVFADADKEKSFKHLRFARGKADIPDEVHYYLGKAYHLNYQFADALKEFQIYQEKTTGNRRKKYDVELAIMQCKNGMGLLSQIKDIRVLNKTETSEAEFFRSYDLSNIGGRVLVCPEELLTRFDLRTGERFLMYFPGNTSMAFISSYGNDGKNGRDIYRVTRLPNGNWSKPVPMTAINTPYNDNFPFLHPDGKTFYFSSEGHNSMGGYDVFRSTYNADDNSFTQPENLDFAVNSPDDDMLYITDQHHQLAYFASSRSSNHGRMHVYQVKVSSNELQLVLIKGKFIPEADGVTNSAEITVTDAHSNRTVGVYFTNPDNGEYLIDLPRSGSYKFTVDATGSELAHNGIVEVPSNTEVVAYAQELLLTRTNSIEKLIIKNHFDQPLDTDLYALAQQVLKGRAALEINYNTSEDDQPAPVVVSDDISAAYHEAGFAQSLSNEQVVENARKEVEALHRKADDIRGQRDFAYTMAQRKQQTAEEAAHDAGDLLRMADAVGDENISSQYLMKAMAGKFVSEKQAEEAAVALHLAQQLDERLQEVEQEQQLATAMADQVEMALNNSDKEELIAVFTKLKEREVGQGGNPVHQHDEVLRLRSMARQHKEEIQSEIEAVQQLRSTESSLESRIKARKLQLETARSRDKSQISREVEALEQDLADLKQDLAERINQLEPKQQHSLSLEQQAALYEKIDASQTDLYIPAEQIAAFNPQGANEITQSLSENEAQTAALEPNLAVVRNIIEEETNVAIQAFKSEAELNAFMKRYEISAPTANREIAVQQPKRNESDIQREMAASRDWIEIIDESVKALENERAALPVGANRDSIDLKLAEFQRLKFQKVQEIDAAETELAELGAQTTTPEPAVTPEVIRSAETDYVSTETARTDAQTNDNIEVLREDYDEQFEALSNRDIPETDKLKQSVALKSQFLATVEKEIETIQENPTSSLTSEEQRRLSTLQTFRTQLSEQLIETEMELAHVESASLSTSESTQDEVAEAAVDEPPSDTPDSATAAQTDDHETQTHIPTPLADPNQLTIADIPPAESLSYSSIDPNYEQQLRILRQSNLEEEEVLKAETELHDKLVQRIDELLVAYRRLSEQASGNEKLSVENAISQMQQIRNLKAREVELNEIKISEMQVERFTTENAIVSEQLDENYVRRYFEIENSTDEPHQKSIRKAQLEQSVAESAAAQIADLVQQMDDATDNQEKEQIQEVIQQLTIIQQQKQTESEQLFVRAEELRSEIDRESLAAEEPEAQISPVMENEMAEQTDEDMADAPVESDVAQQSPEAPREIEQDVALESTQESRDEESESYVDEAVPAMAESSGIIENEAEVAAIRTLFENDLTTLISEDEQIVADLSELTVFGEVNNMEYKSLNASLDMIAIGGDMERHQQRMTAFVQQHASTPLDAAAQTELKKLLETEIRLQDRIAQAIRRELSFYEISNNEALEMMQADPSSAPSATDLQSAVQAQQQGLALTEEANAQRNQAQSTIDAATRLQLQKQAFEKEVEAAALFSKVNTALTLWRRGEMPAWEDSAVTSVPLVSRSTPLDEVLSVAVSEQAPVMSSSSVGQDQPTETAVEKTTETAPQEIIRTLETAQGAPLENQNQQHFELSPEAMERINASAVYTDWFRTQWMADSLEALRAAKFVEAEETLNQAEALLAESESVAEMAGESTDETERNVAYNRAAELQDEARRLFEMAQRLRNEMGEYSAAVENSRAKADSVLTTIDNEEAVALQEMISAAVLADGPEPAPDVEVETPEQEVAPESLAIERSEVRTAQPESQRADRTETRETAPQPAEQIQPTPQRPQIAPQQLLAEGVEAIFETTAQAVYSTENPIPVNVDWPDGLVFAVQVGAFRNPIPQDHFRGFTPVRGERISSGITRYSAGLFTLFDRADAAKNSIREMGYGDAFVVAYLNGERVPLNRALNEAEAAEIIALAQEQQEATSRPSTPATTSAEPAEDRMVEEERPTTESSRDTGEGETPRTAGQTSPDEAAGTSIAELPEVGDYYNDPDAAPAVQVEQVRGLFFTVQVGVYSNPVSEDQLFGITPLNSELTSNGHIRYTSGRFTSLDLARDHQQNVINAGIPDAFITAYFNGERIAVARATTILVEQGESALAGNQPSIDTSDEPVVSPSEPSPTPTQPMPPASDEDNADDADDADDADYAFFADAADFAPEDIKFVVDLGSFGRGIPQSTADAILQIPDAGVSRNQLPGGTLHYLSRPFDDYQLAESMMERFREAGVEIVQIRAVALGFLVDVEDAKRRKEN